MSTESNALVQRLAFASALSELTQSPICGIIKKDVGSKKLKYVLKEVYGKLPCGNVLTMAGITEEEKIVSKHLGAFVVMTDNEKHLLDFVKTDLDKVYFNKIKQNFKKAIVDNYGTQLTA